MPDKLVRMRRALGEGRDRPVMLAIAGDSAAGKTTLSRGLVAALGADRARALCVDDYHRYDRTERRGLPFTPLHPDCNHVEIMAQHLQLLATGQPILKPVYDHATGQLIRPELVEPTPYLIVEGLLPLHTAVMRACFDLTVYLDPPEAIRRDWKVARDTAARGYTRTQVLDELERREPESESFIRVQRQHADVVARFGPIPGRDDPPGTPLSAELLLRAGRRRRDLSELLGIDERRTIHCKLVRDNGGAPVDAVHVHGYASAEDAAVVAKRLWAGLDLDGPVPSSLGELAPGQRSDPLALTQLVLLSQLLG